MVKAVGLGELTSTAAVGSVLVLGIILGLDAFIEIRDFFEYATSLAAWDIVLALPVLFVTWMTGAVAIQTTAWWHERQRGETAGEYAQRVIAFGKAGQDYVVSEYSRLVRELELLQAVGPAFFVFATGIALKALNATPDFGGRLEFGRVIFLAVALVVFAVIGLTVALARRTRAKIIALVQAQKDSQRRPDAPVLDELVASGTVAK
jgi:hypothetical protein